MKRKNCARCVCNKRAGWSYTCHENIYAVKRVNKETQTCEDTKCTSNLWLKKISFHCGLVVSLKRISSCGLELVTFHFVVFILVFQKMIWFQWVMLMSQTVTYKLRQNLVTHPRTALWRHPASCQTPVSPGPVFYITPKGRCVHRGSPVKLCRRIPAACAAATKLSLDATGRFHIATCDHTPTGGRSYTPCRDWWWWFLAGSLSVWQLICLSLLFEARLQDDAGKAWPSFPLDINERRCECFSKNKHVKCVPLQLSTCDVVFHG